MISLVDDTIDKNDIENLISWLRTYPRLTQGPKTVEFEKKWANYIGTNESVFVNSGSSAILVVLQTLLEAEKIRKGDTIVVPALAWATDLAPVVQLGFNPILCDCNLEDLSINLEHFETLCKEHSPSALIFVSVLGLVPDMTRLMSLCKEYSVLMLEDTCESFGSKYKDRFLGNFGLFSVFSTYFGHHLSTIEGGLICTNDTDLAQVARGVRNHGWDRNYSEDHKKKLREEWNVSEFNALYTFYLLGFNVRSTDLQAHIGINQLDKASTVNYRREKNFRLYQENIKNTYWSPVYRKDSFISNFAFPILHPNRDKIVKNLKLEDIEVRPMICRSMGVQPSYVKLFGKQSLGNADIVDQFGMYIPNHPKISEQDIMLVSKVINKCM